MSAYLKDHELVVYGHFIDQGLSLGCAGFILMAQGAFHAALHEILARGLWGVRAALATGINKPFHVLPPVLTRSCREFS
jgi:hypothetical protein